MNPRAIAVDGAGTMAYAIRYQNADLVELDIAAGTTSTETFDRNLVAVLVDGNGDLLVGKNAPGGGQPSDDATLVTWDGTTETAIPGFQRPIRAMNWNTAGTHAWVYDGTDVHYVELATGTIARSATVSPNRPHHHLQVWQRQ